MLAEEKSRKQLAGAIGSEHICHGATDVACDGDEPVCDRLGAFYRIRTCQRNDELFAAGIDPAGTVENIGRRQAKDMGQLDLADLEVTVGRCVGGQRPNIPLGRYRNDAGFHLQRYLAGRFE